jgi:hypothetical protein
VVALFVAKILTNLSTWTIFFGNFLPSGCQEKRLLMAAILCSNQGWQMAQLLTDKNSKNHVTKVWPLRKMLEKGGRLAQTTPVDARNVQNAWVGN